MRNTAKALGLSLVLFGAVHAHAIEPFSLDDYSYANADKSFTFSASAGVLALEGREHVFLFSGSETNLSLLVWQSVSPMVSASASANFGGGWTISAEGRVAASGFGYMEDYDWFGPGLIDYQFDNWTHRSQHSNTNLDWFVDGSIRGGYDFDLGDGMRTNAHVGIAYTDVQWTAVGGTFVYSVGGFRDTSGAFADIPMITYRQQLPSIFIGADTSYEKGSFTFDLGARVGMTVLANATDWHWHPTRRTRFDDALTPAPTLGGSFRANYDFNDSFSVFLAGRVDKLFLMRGDTQLYDIDTGAATGGSTDTAGAELLSGSISAGLKGTFK